MNDELHTIIEANALSEFSEFKEKCPHVFATGADETLIKHIFICGFSCGAIFGSRYNPHLLP